MFSRRTLAFWIQLNRLRLHYDINRCQFCINVFSVELDQIVHLTVLFISFKMIYWYDSTIVYFETLNSIRNLTFRFHTFQYFKINDKWGFHINYITFGSVQLNRMFMKESCLMYTLKTYSCGQISHYLTFQKGFFIYYFLLTIIKI